MDMDNQIGYWLKGVDYICHFDKKNNEVKRFYLVEDITPLSLLLTNFFIDECDERIRNLFGVITKQQLKSYIQNYPNFEIRKEGKLSDNEKFPKIRKIVICHTRNKIDRGISIYRLNDRIVKKIFEEAKEKKLLVSFVTPPSDDNYLPPLKKPKHSGKKPFQKSGLIWLSIPKRSTSSRSWYSFAKKNLPKMVDVTKKAIIGYKIDMTDILVVNEKNMQKFEEMYAKNLKKEMIDIKWKDVASKYKGFALDPYDNYFTGMDYAHYWTSYFDAVTYIIWDKSAIIDHEILYSPKWLNWKFTFPE